MDSNSMRNIVILRDLPSNLIEEVFVVLKENQKIKKVEYAENKIDKFEEKKQDDSDNEYVVREAELLVTNYINKIENKQINKLEAELSKKYKRLKSITSILIFFLIVSIICVL